MCIYKNTDFLHKDNAIIPLTQLTIILWYHLIPSPHPCFPTCLRNVTVDLFKSRDKQVCKLACVEFLRSLTVAYSLLLFFHTIDLL